MSRLGSAGRTFVLGALMCTGAACTSAARTPGAGGAAGTDAGTGGAPATGGAGGGGGHADKVGSGGSDGNDGDGGSPAGGHAGNAGRGSGGARDAGPDRASTDAGALGGHAAGGSDGLAAAQVLDGFALLKPCFAPPSGCCCDENAAAILNSGSAPENQHLTKQFGGDPGTTYQVKLRVVGVAERYWYAGGALDAASKVFYTGGLPTIHMPPQAPNSNLAPGKGACKIHPPETDKAPYNFPIPFTVPPEVAPADGCYNGFNIFALTLSSPKQTYYLNYTSDYDGVDRQPHSVYKTDYTVVIPIAGRAQLDFYVIDGDHHEVANTTMTVPNVKNQTIKQPYSGNFLELEVVGVTSSK